MNPLFRFVFHPSAKDRYWCGWVAVGMTLIPAIGIVVALKQHHLYAVASNIVMAVWNSVTAWANFTVHKDWKQGKIPH